jgi:hypothetical protein
LLAFKDSLLVIASAEGDFFCHARPSGPILETRLRLTESSMRELEDVLETLFEKPKMISNLMAECPIVGTPYIVVLNHSHFLPVICRAMRALKNPPGGSWMARFAAA